MGEGGRESCSVIINSKTGRVFSINIFPCIDNGWALDYSKHSTPWYSEDDHDRVGWPWEHPMEFQCRGNIDVMLNDHYAWDFDLFFHGLYLRHISSDLVPNLLFLEREPCG